MKYLFIISFLIQSLHAAVLQKESNGDYKILKNSFLASEILGDYVRLENLNANIESSFKDETFATQGNPRIGKNDIHKYISSVMARSGYTVIRFPGSPQIQIVDARDSRYTTVPVFTDPLKIPNTEDFIQFNYTLKHILASELSRNMRPFMSRYGRVIDMASSNSIHFLDSGSNVIRMVKLIQYLDTEEIAKSAVEIQELNEKYKVNVAKTKTFMDILSGNNGLFIIIFLLMGLIMGFGIRGFMMKRVEGGW